MEETAQPIYRQAAFKAAIAREVRQTIGNLIRRDWEATSDETIQRLPNRTVPKKTALVTKEEVDNMNDHTYNIYEQLFL